MIFVDIITRIAYNLKYGLVRKIAEGGMGVVYEAVQHGVEDFAKTVAIKVILEEYSAIKEFRSNFIGEAKLVADLIHTNIVQTYHLGEHESQYYMVMEYVNGVNFEQFLMRHCVIKQYVPVDLAAFVVSRICRGLSYAHNKKGKDGQLLGIVHRDVSPRNIMISYEGDVKVTDFGIAKARNLMYNKEGDVIAGKDEYLSPEQAKKEVTDHRADLFSCGVILGELLLGYNLFEAENPEGTRQRILEGGMPNFCELRPEIDPALNTILHKALAKDRDCRYQSASEMLYELEVYLYSDRYGPTNEKLATYLQELFKRSDATAMKYWKENASKGISCPGLLQ